MTDPAPELDLRQVRLRLAEQRDVPAVCELFRQGMLEGQLRENDTGADIENLAEAYFADEGASAFWVACQGDDVVGMIGVQRTQENTAEVRRLRVRQDCRRRGVGSLLLAEATEFCRRNGYLKVVLDVRIERAPAIAMFEKFGFILARSTGGHDGRPLMDFYMDLYREPESGARKAQDPRAEESS